MLKTISLLIAVGLLSSCGTKTIATAVRLDCPPPLVFPAGTHTLSLAQDDHLFNDHQDIYQVFGNRETLMQDRIETMCNIIQSTHE